jgi:sugar phosphate isomerase/epimerase
MIFVSTTYPRQKKSNLEKVLNQLNRLQIDGIEIGSTHKYETKQNLKKIIKNNQKKIFYVHNFFPPSKDDKFVINIASTNAGIKKNSLDMIISNIDFCKDIGAQLYTIHPGFLSQPVPKTDFIKNNYDFDFDKNYVSNKSEAFENMVKSLKKITNYANKKKIKLAIETEGSNKKKNYLIMQEPNEYKRLFKEIPKYLFINLNLSHTYFASNYLKFSMKSFIKLLHNRIVAIEISDNDGFNDQHKPLFNKSKYLPYLDLLKKRIPVILEFRNAKLSDIKNSIKLVQNHNEKKQNNFK